MSHRRPSMRKTILANWMGADPDADTRTGETRSYANPQSVPFEIIQDTGAFDACP